MADEPLKKIRVCVVGAGAGGLCAARHMAGNSLFEFSLFEQTDAIGGTWVYNEKIGVDKNGLPIHSSMYQNLRTNLPGLIMNFPDYLRMGNEDHSCLTHAEVLCYLLDYANHFDLYKYITLNTKIELIKPESSNNGEILWIVQSRNLKTHEISVNNYDAVIVCNGHYFDPYIPQIPGIDQFPGIIMHSHFYRRPELYTGKVVFILGAAASGVDISFDLLPHASQVYLSHNNEKLTNGVSSKLMEVVGVERIENNTFFLKDGSNMTVDVFIICTGYRYSFPFLDNSCGIRVDENHVTSLYKHLINIEHPTMCLIGIPTHVIPFPLFHVQVQYFLALLSKKISLPTKEILLEDSRLQVNVKKRHAHRLMDAQWDYNDSLADLGQFHRLPLFYKNGYTIWGARRKADLYHYKDSKVKLSEDGITVNVIPFNKQS